MMTTYQHSKEPGVLPGPLGLNAPLPGPPPLVPVLPVGVGTEVPIRPRGFH